MKTISVIKLIPFSVPGKNGSLTVYGKIYTMDEAIYWDFNYRSKRTYNSTYHHLPVKCDSVEEAEEAMAVYVREFSDEYVYNSKF
jgi:hypothetical protein